METPEGSIIVEEKKEKNYIFRCALNAACKTDEKQIRENRRKVRAGHYGYIDRGFLLHPRCALVGGGPSVEYKLDELRNWKGDIFAINDTAGYLSENGIPCYLYGIDCDPNLWKIGPLVKGAYLASRCHINQFKQFSRKKIRIFDMGEDNAEFGIEGGPTAACRAIHLFSLMGYWGVTLFGCEGSFFLDRTHVTRHQKVAYTNLMIVRVRDIDYITNAALRLQCAWFVDLLTPKSSEEKEIKRATAMMIYTQSRCGGLLDAMIKYPSQWEDVAITDEIKQQYESAKVPLTFNEYKWEGRKIWLPQPVV